MNKSPILRTKQHVSAISGWKTDLASIDYCHCHNDNQVVEEEIIIPPHTIFMFVPGNPGCIGWYLDMLYTIVEKLGVGYAVRAASYAGHAIGKEKIEIINNHDDCDDHGNNRNGLSINKRKLDVAYTVDGQVEHKIEWVDLVLDETKLLLQKNHAKIPPMKFIFITHSIGAHLVQRMLLLRRDILLQTKLIIHLTPFHRFDPDSIWKKNILSTVANEPQMAIKLLKSIGYVVSKLPHPLVDMYMRKVAAMPLEKDRKLAKDLYTQPQYAHNFFELGTEEIRELPEIHDEGALRIIGKFCPTAILYCPNDHWAPLSHMNDIHESQKAKKIPGNISLCFSDQLVHGFVVFPHMIPHVVEFVMESMKLIKEQDCCEKLRSKL